MGIWDWYVQAWQSDAAVVMLLLHLLVVGAVVRFFRGDKQPET